MIYLFLIPVYFILWISTYFFLRGYSERYFKNYFDDYRRVGSSRASRPSKLGRFRALRISFFVAPLFPLVPFFMLFQGLYAWIKEEFFNQI
jgi:hypothetical protein